MIKVTKRDTMSIIIPVYREAKNLENILKALINEETLEFEKEIIVTVDEPSPRFVKIISKYQNSVTFLISKKRRGKVNALNDAISRSSGRILVFLDNDIKIRDKNFLKTIYKFMKDYDIAEIKKTSNRKKILGRMVYYDYLTFSVASYLFYKKLKKSAGINGAAFVLTRKSVKELGGFKQCILEDLDIGYRSFFHSLRFKFIHETEVIVDPPSSWREWLDQRKRWVIGAALWMKDYFFHLKRFAKKNKRLSLLSTITLFPSGLFPLFMLASTFRPLESFVLILLYILVGYFGPFFPIAVLLSYGFTFLLLQNFLALSAYFLVFMFYIYRYAKKINYGLNPFWFFVYFFFYAPLWFMLLVAGFIRVLVFKKTEIRGWKI